MQVLLGITLCALLLTLRSGVLVFAGEDDDVDAWGSIDSYFDYDAYDDAHRPAAVGAAIGQAASSAPHTEDTCSDPNPSSAADHPVGADGPTWGQSDPFDARTLDRFPGDDRETTIPCNASIAGKGSAILTIAWHTRAVAV
ncbi:Secreted protein [Plasmodiophora brassicae]|uniref:Secreted protein n=1 Tax=Plasmodiophora brassicae TaxID=37360 RepID=A0A3P3Y6T2_PLABS|nr:unnamed protein product [Plasmodiophora brassicae]